MVVHEEVHYSSEEYEDMEDLMEAEKSWFDIGLFGDVDDGPCGEEEGAAEKIDYC